MGPPSARPQHVLWDARATCRPPAPGGGGGPTAGARPDALTAPPPPHSENRVGAGIRDAKLPREAVRRPGPSTYRGTRRRSPAQRRPPGTRTRGAKRPREAARRPGPSTCCGSARTTCRPPAPGRTARTAGKPVPMRSQHRHPRRANTQSGPGCATRSYRVRPSADPAPARTAGHGAAAPRSGGPRSRGARRGAAAWGVGATALRARQGSGKGRGGGMSSPTPRRRLR